MASRKAGQGSKWIRPEKRMAIYARDDHRCVYCGYGLAEGVMLTLDHITPCELGGDNREQNLVTACLCCNSAKRALPLRQWLMTLADKGIDPASVAGRVRRQTRRVLRRGK